MAFYSDRLSVFHVQARDRAENGPGLSQFGRALRELNIDLLCARSPEAKGRVERAHGTLQDRLVKELRLRGLDDPIAAAPFLPAFRADYNRRFAKPPAVAYDAHRPLRPDDDLARLFTLLETRRISRQLTGTTSGTSTSSRTRLPPGSCGARQRWSVKPRMARSRSAPMATC